MNWKQKNKGSLCRFLFLGCAVLGGLELLGTAAAKIAAIVMGVGASLNTTASSVGIIGGADGPTAVFVTTISAPLQAYILPVAMVIIGIIGYTWLRKKNG